MPRYQGRRRYWGMPRYRETSAGWVGDGVVRVLVEGGMLRYTWECARRHWQNSQCHWEQSHWEGTSVFKLLLMFDLITNKSLQKQSCIELPVFYVFGVLFVLLWICKNKLSISIVWVCVVNVYAFGISNTSKLQEH